MTLQRIDVHHHVLPPEYLAAMDRLGLKEAGGVAFPDWSPAASIEMMDRQGIQTGHCFGFVAGSLFR
jgi:6-methylsalicylate decarboxylase